LFGRQHDKDVAARRRLAVDPAHGAGGDVVGLRLDARPARLLPAGEVEADLQILRRLPPVAHIFGDELTGPDTGFSAPWSRRDDPHPMRLSGTPADRPRPPAGRGVSLIVDRPRVAPRRHDPSVYRHLKIAEALRLAGGHFGRAAVSGAIVVF